MLSFKQNTDQQRQIAHACLHYLEPGVRGSKKLIGVAAEFRAIINIHSQLHEKVFHFWYKMINFGIMNHLISSQTKKMIFYTKIDHSIPRNETLLMQLFSWGQQ